VGRALGRAARTIRPHAVKRFVMRGIAGPFERSWSGEPGTLPWTKLFLPLSLGYRAGSGLARRRAAGRRRTLEDCHVIAVGNVTVGGVGKSSLARWLALEAVGAGVRSGILLRGHGAGGASREGGVVPDATRAWVARFAPGIPSLRFTRTLRCLTPVGEPAAGEPLRPGGRVALVSGIGAPRRLERFVRAAGADIRLHAVYPDHARWT